VKSCGSMRALLLSQWARNPSTRSTPDCIKAQPSWCTTRSPTPRCKASQMSALVLRPVRVGHGPPGNNLARIGRSARHEPHTRPVSAEAGPLRATTPGRGNSRVRGRVAQQTPGGVFWSVSACPVGRTRVPVQLQPPIIPGVADPLRRDNQGESSLIQIVALHWGGYKGYPFA
jgi:hypothetical protein